jgi:hypothetical protein
MRLQIARGSRAVTGGAARKMIGRCALAAVGAGFLCDLHRRVWRRSGDWLFDRNDRSIASRTGRPPTNAGSANCPSRRQAGSLPAARSDR